MAGTVHATEGTIGPWFYENIGANLEEYDDGGETKSRARFSCTRRRTLYKFAGFSSDEGATSTVFPWAWDTPCIVAQSGNMTTTTAILDDHSAKQIDESGTWEELQVWNSPPSEYS